MGANQSSKSLAGTQAARETQLENTQPLWRQEAPTIPAGKSNTTESSMATSSSARGTRRRLGRSLRKSFGSFGLRSRQKASCAEFDALKAASQLGGSKENVDHYQAASNTIENDPPRPPIERSVDDWPPEGYNLTRMGNQQPQTGRPFRSGQFGATSSWAGPDVAAFYATSNNANLQFNIANAKHSDASFAASAGYTSPPEAQKQQQQQQLQYQAYNRRGHSYANSVNGKHALVGGATSNLRQPFHLSPSTNTTPSYSSKAKQSSPGSSRKSSSSSSGSSGGGGGGGSVAMPNFVGRREAKLQPTKLYCQQPVANKQLNAPYQHQYQFQVNNNCSTNQHAYLPQMLRANNMPAGQQQQDRLSWKAPERSNQQQIVHMRAAGRSNSKSSPEQPEYYQHQPPVDFHLSSYNFGPPLSTTSTSQQLRGGYTIGNAPEVKHRKSSSGSNPLASLFARPSANTIHLGRLPRDRLPKPTGNTNDRSSSLKRIKSSPLSAQQASYEAMRTIDMYLIRQIARSCLDFEMEQKIDLEIRLRELAAQSMLEARTQIDLLEVEKSLLTSDQRMNCYASQLEQQRKQLSNPSLSTDSGRGSKSGSRQRVVGGGSSCASSTDVIGGPQSCNMKPNYEGSSPSFGSSSLSASQSPSKLSPVSGESANSPSFTATTNSSHHSRMGALRHSTNTLSAKQKAKNKRREQLMQSITCQSNINCKMVVNKRASLSVSELRIPLMWRDVDHFKGKGDYKRYAIFCLLKIDSQIYDTQLISDVDREITDVTFDDLVVFNEIEHNFELHLEVYSCVYLEQFSLSSTPRKLKEKLTSSVSRAMGRRLATQTASANYIRELQAYDKSYRFAMIASAVLKLDEASNSVKTYDLVLVSPSAHHRHQQAQTFNTSSHSSGRDADRNTLPLFGHFCCKLMVVPDVFDQNVKSGFVKVATINQPSQSDSQDSSGRGSETPPGANSQLNDKNGYASSCKMYTMSKSNAITYYALLRNFTLHLWQVDQKRLDMSMARHEMPQIDNLHRPSLVVSIDKYTRLLRVSNTSLTIEVMQRGILMLAPYCPDLRIQANHPDEMASWLRAIEQSIYDSHIWAQVLNHYPPASKSSTSHNNNIADSSAITKNPSRESSLLAISDSRERSYNFNTGKSRQSREYYANRSVLEADL